MVLSAAGASLGGAVGGSFLGLGAATLGKAVGGIAGGLIDQQVLGRGGGTVETGRVERIRLQGAAEGAPIPRLWGRMRLGGQVIWSSQFTENVDESRQGGKGGGPKVREFSYTVSFAVALCEGRINRLGRVWADGNEISIADYAHTLHRGEEGQSPDPVIADIEGDAPAFRGVAYVVFEDFPLSPFGNRIPQLNFEVFREPAVASDATDPEERAEPLTALVKGVALSPGSGEFSLETRKVRRLVAHGQTVLENVNTLSERPDFLVGVDQLEEEAGACGAVSLIVSWFGDDLRCGCCSIEPRIETDDKETEPAVWRVSGVGRGGARQVSQDSHGRPTFGGTPSDGSVIEAIKNLKARGYRVLFYPFILMDVPPGNGRSDPWSDASDQPVFPWRGRITTENAPDRPGTTDKTAAAAAEVSAFFGGAGVGDFSPSGSIVNYSGPNEWSMRRFILHYAHLCELAGGVDGFCIGTEMRSLTQIRSSASAYPAVERFRTLAEDVRSVMGQGTEIGYAADWSEYFGHHPQDGSGDAFFHLDPLWADPAIDFIGIDNYFPLADWRYREGHADEAAKSPYSLAYLKGNVAGGEGHEWFYASAADRDAQVRSPIADGAHGEDWVFRPKDLKSWWSEPHRNRPGGVRDVLPTVWVPESKPIYFTEIGCPAVDLGANQPNVFVDPKSSESFLPHYSRGVRDDFMQRRYLQAALSFWEDPANNPASGVYAGRMVDVANTYVWTWDARPWPDFPERLDTWSDGLNHRVGHWLTGRLGAASLADVVAEICARSGVAAFDVSALHGVVHGFAQEDDVTGRAALQALMMTHAFDAFESGGVLRFTHRGGPVSAEVAQGDVAMSRDGGADLNFIRNPEGDAPGVVRISYVDGERTYEPGAVEAASQEALSERVFTASAPIVLDSGTAQTIAGRYLSEARIGREGAEATLGRKWSGLEPGDVVRLESDVSGARYRVDAVAEGLTIRATLTRDEGATALKRSRPSRRALRPVTTPAGPVESVLLDAPVLRDGAPILRAGALAEPWSGTASFLRSPDGESFDQVARAARPMTSGVLEAVLPPSDCAIWQRGEIAVRLFRGGLEARADLAVLNGANAALIEHPGGDWEVVQFAGAELIGDDLWRLSRLLRGRAGTEFLAAESVDAGARFILLDDALIDVEGAAATRGLSRSWRVGPSRKHHSHDSYTAFDHVYEAEGLRPYAPVKLNATRAPNGDVEISWVRRSRLDEDAWTTSEPPLGEARELYQLSVEGRPPIEVNEPRWTYTAAAQVADGVAEPFDIAVAQTSEIYGPGTETRIVFNG
ncbi:MAG: glycoside hydrolase TIM-barrel-like domain-containing protein [Pseudomonadota bacterium]